ncbi:MAG: hypothetical protein ACP6KW_10285 [Candidatus Thorarchaeota archaeon]
MVIGCSEIIHRFIAEVLYNNQSTTIRNEGAMKGIIVFDDSGVNLASVGLEEVKVDPSIFSSFMSAIQSFARQFTGSDMKEVKYSKIRLMMGEAGHKYVVTLHAIDDPDAQWNHGATLRVIKGEDFVLNDQFLGILRDLLTEDKLTLEDLRPPRDLRL